MDTFAQVGQAANLTEPRVQHAVPMESRSTMPVV
jgi:hypothetical protein